MYSDAVVKAYMTEVLGLDTELVERLFSEYVRTFNGQVLSGLRQDLDVDPVHFEAWIDDRANLTDAISPNPEVIKTLSISKARNWIFTNSGKQHSLRVITALSLEPFIEGLVFIDYSKEQPIKPSKEAFEGAMEAAGLHDPSKCHLVDDILTNVTGACLAGWNAVHFCELHFCVISFRLFRRDADQCSSLPAVSFIGSIPSAFPHLFL